MSKLVLKADPLGFPWPCLDPFLFCAWHNDQFPAAGPKAALPAGNWSLCQAQNKKGSRQGQGKPRGSALSTNLDILGHLKTVKRIRNVEHQLYGTADQSVLA